MSKSKNKSYAIGVFDSGIGGLTVVKELIRCLPNEDIVYYGDTARVPYGTKSRESIVRFSHENARVLLKHKVKMIVVACNSSASVALKKLKGSLSVPVVGVIDPGARKAGRVTKNNKVGVIATSATVRSGAYPKKIKQLKKTVKVTSQACPLFVPLAEEGWFGKKETEAIAGIYLSKLKKAKVDSLILGCTHYPLLKTVIKKVMGKKVALIDSAKETALEVKDRLKRKNMARTGRQKPKYRFLVSDDPRHFRQLAKRFLGREVRNIKRIKQ